MTEHRYPPIADYALLSDCHSSALVSRDLSVDWACLRRFDAASSFGRILDWERGGHFCLTPLDLRRCSRRYVGYSLVLEHEVETATGRARVQDAFAMRRGGAYRPYNQLVRVVEGLDGTVTFDAVIEPRFDYGELRPWLREHPASQGGVPAYSAVGGDHALVMTSPIRLHVDDAVEVRFTGRFTVARNDQVAFGVRAQEPHRLLPHPTEQKELLARMHETLEWWERWSAATVADGPYAPHVRRSAVVLKGLTCAPTGAIIAAPTTSLPEEVGGERNWDYRFSWIRDSTFVLAALTVVGHDEVARGFRDFLLRTAAGDPADLQIMYGPYGARHLPEYELRLSGYRDSRPVRVGNAAARQRQHDVYGHILDAAHLWRRTHEEVTPVEWRFLHRLVDEAAAVWRKPDHGMWEVRGEPRHFVTSKVMLWVALERGITVAQETGFDDGDVDRWRAVRDEIRATIEREGVDPARGNFVQSFGSTELDAGLLLLPMVGFVAPDDPRMLATVDALRADLAVPPHGFLRRYRTERTDDGLRGDEGTFLMCSFWLAEILAMQGRQDEARALFERLLTVANDVGLYAEEYDSATEEHVGNFPQAFTHMALINAAHQRARTRAGAVVGDERRWPVTERLTEGAE